jgi:hypothetical protein
METSHIHQTKYDQRTKPAAIAPSHGDRDEDVADVANETNRVDWAMVYPPNQRREHNTLCHRMSAF